MIKQKCTECERELNEDKIVWLVLSNKTGKYYLEISSALVPENENQGAFPFGRDCAIKIACIYHSENPAL